MMDQKGNAKEGAFNLINPNAAGIDIGSEVHYVAVPEDRAEQSIRTFSCFTADLYRLAEWLKSCRINAVAMESTGVYWIPLYQVLEASGFAVTLVNAKHVRHVPGRKTDVKDCRWLQQLHSYGLLSASFRPADEICVLRGYVRHRDNIIKSRSPHIQRMQKACIQMNIQLHKVISDITGETGLRIIRAIVAGERNPVTLARMKNQRVKSSEEEIAAALQGDYRAEQLFVLKQELAAYDFWCGQLDECELEIKHYLTQVESQPPTDARKGKPPRATIDPSAEQKKARRDTRGTELQRIAGVDFNAIDGFDSTISQSIIAEVGLDAGKWRTEKEFSSWLGLCPNHKITGKRVKDSRTKKVKNRASLAFRLAARSAGNSHSAIGAYYRRMKSRIGAPKAITATAHKLACIFYRMLKFGEQYADCGMDYYEKKYKQRVLSNLARRAKELGFTLTSAGSGTLCPE